ncbi:MAG TPA: hypothetical protein VKH19_04950 [Gemmatimonadaceae bacterium]|nr:hypothetical protein [Gemmatimonadaceae bacterium]
MRIAPLAALLVAVPMVLSAQTPSSSTTRVYTSNGAVTRTPPETVYVRGTVTGIVPTGTNYVITGSKTSWIVDTVYTSNPNVSGNMNDMNMSSSTSMDNDAGKNDLEKTTDKAGKDVSNAGKKAGKDISNEAKRTPKNVSKSAKKVGHGVKEAASDVKKAVTGKP